MTTWISVKDRLPEEEGYYPAVFQYNDEQYIQQYRGLADFICNHGFESTKFTVTHWLEYPELPEVTE